MNVDLAMTQISMQHFFPPVCVLIGSLGREVGEVAFFHGGISGTDFN